MIIVSKKYITKMKLTTKQYKSALIMAETIAKELGEKDFVFSKVRTPNLVEINRTMMYLLRTKTNASLTDIGKLMNMHHSTIIHGFNQFVIESEHYLYSRIIKDIIDKMQVDINVVNIKYLKDEINEKIINPIEYLFSMFDLNIHNININQDRNSDKFAKIINILRYDLGISGVRVNKILNIDGLNEDIIRRILISPKCSKINNHYINETNQFIEYILNKIN